MSKCCPSASKQHSVVTLVLTLEVLFTEAASLNGQLFILLDLDRCSLFLMENRCSLWQTARYMDLSDQDIRHQ